jgi:hypothetical protein
MASVTCEATVHCTCLHAAHNPVARNSSSITHRPLTRNYQHARYSQRHVLPNTSSLPPIAFYKGRWSTTDELKETPDTIPHGEAGSDRFQRQAVELRLIPA